jgi:hypothetical protein
MATASRSNQLKIRLQHIEATVPPLEKAMLAQTTHIHFAYTGGLFCLLPSCQSSYCLDPRCLILVRFHINSFNKLCHILSSL